MQSNAYFKAQLQQNAILQQKILNLETMQKGDNSKVLMEQRKLTSEIAVLFSLKDLQESLLRKDRAYTELKIEFERLQKIERSLSSDVQSYKSLLEQKKQENQKLVREVLLTVVRAVPIRRPESADSGGRLLRRRQVRVDEEGNRIPVVLSLGRERRRTSSLRLRSSSSKSLG